MSKKKEQQHEETAPVRTVNGKPIPPEFAHAIPYPLTDQGREEARKGKLQSSGVEFGASQWDKQVKQFNDLPFLHNDPLKAASDRHRTPGMVHRFLSPDLDKQRGNPAARGYRVVKDEHGDPVRVGDLILGEMPTQVAAARQRHYEGLAEKEMKAIAEEGQEKTAQLIHASRKAGLEVLPLGSDLKDTRTGEHMTTGVTSVRGEPNG